MHAARRCYGAAPRVDDRLIYAPKTLALLFTLPPPQPKPIRTAGQRDDAVFFKKRKQHLLRVLLHAIRLVATLEQLSLDIL